MPPSSSSAYEQEGRAEPDAAQVQCSVCRGTKQCSFCNRDGYVVEHRNLSTCGVCATGGLCAPVRPEK